MAKKQTVSQQTIDDALKIAKGTARPGQTKEQTKQIAQGIEKGIAEFKKREKAKARERDKARKKASPAEELPTTKTTEPTDPSPSASAAVWLPWVLLALSWIGFAIYVGLF
ncbi:DUF2956 domain-containing protein [Reinekea blandensis]|uniref:DUF2956 domain-containing protein n=1 Tax=Reinekea blandensis MED297 TaxID=314283 RepID=A4BBE3_9GAMM|nr:DUF2956 domain-containing protein [Reinekea blandensis]EAR10756.1 hypothetical protein MED297_12090 [Reinekea sp. MED297] [Reinekea blandensis MED297]